MNGLPAGRLRRLLAAALPLLVLPLLPLPAQAQLVRGAAPAPRWWGDVGVTYSQPQGPFGERVDHAWGFQLGGRYLPSPGGVLAIRLDVGMMRYGRETAQVCLPLPIGCRIGAEVDTENDIYYFGAGPELGAFGGRLYAFGTIGASFFATSSSLSGLDDDEAYLSTNNQSDGVFAYRLGGGVRIPLGGSENPVRLDLGADYHRNGTAEYLVEGDIVTNPDGSITIFPNRTEANVLTWRLGITIGGGG